MLQHKIADLGLADQGNLKLDWAEQHMPVLMKIKAEFEQSLPFAGMAIATCLHITKESGVLVRVLAAGGARVSLAACNPLSTQDDVAAALAAEGHAIFGWRGLDNAAYYENINHALDIEPDITIDDASDLVFMVHTKRTELLSKIKGGCEETTSGIIRLRAMEKEGALRYPMMAVNDARTKHLFDNRYGTGQSTFDGILRGSNILVAGKVVVVAGYGWCGRGIAMRAHGMGAQVVVTEIDTVKALEARMDGHRVMSMAEAAPLGDIFVTATGNKHVIRREHLERMRDGALLANSGHFNIEIDCTALAELAVSEREVRPGNVEYTLQNGNRLFLLSEGRLVNLSSAEGHPSEVMDMSFSTQALSAEFIARNYASLENKVYDTSEEQDLRIAGLKLDSMGITIDQLTEEQTEYLSGWMQGTE